VDVVSFTRPDRDNVDQLAIRAALYETLRDAFEDSGIPWRQTVREDRGDGVLIFVSAEVSKVLLLGRMPARLAELLERGNGKRSPRQRFRLRVAVHAGEVHHDAHGYAGYDVNLAFRLVDARPLREGMEHTAAAVGLIVSEGVHDGVLRHGYGGLDAAAFEPVRVQVKSADVPGWVQLFAAGGAVLPVPSQVVTGTAEPAKAGGGSGRGDAGPVAVLLADEASLLDELAGLGVRTVVLVGGAAGLAPGLAPIARQPIYIDHEFIE
jgi:class 3 adenylate cyclase